MVLSTVPAKSLTGATYGDYRPHQSRDDLPTPACGQLGRTAAGQRRVLAEAHERPARHVPSRVARHDDLVRLDVEQLGDAPERRRDRLPDLGQGLDGARDRRTRGDGQAEITGRL